MSYQDVLNDRVAQLQEAIANGGDIRFLAEQLASLNQAIGSSDGGGGGSTIDTATIEYLLNEIDGKLYGILNNTGGVGGGADPAIYHPTYAVNSSAILFKAGAAKLLGWNFINQNNVPVYVKLFNSVNATVGTDNPIAIFAVPANGAFYQEIQSQPQKYFSQGISIACTLDLDSLSTTSIAIDLYAQISYV